MGSADHAYTSEEDLYILRNAHRISFVDIATELKLTKHQARGRYLQLMKAFEEFLKSREAGTAAANTSGQVIPPGDHIHRDEDSGSQQMRLTSLSPRIETLEQLLERAQIDLSRWEVDRCIVNSWEVGCNVPGYGVTVTPLFQVKAFLKAKQAMSLEDHKRQLIEEMVKYAPKYPKLPALRRLGKDRILQEISLFDLHMGKLGWGEETGGDYDHKIATRLFNAAIDQLMDYGQMYKVERFLLPIGNDLLHIDNPESTTHRGTRQDADTRFGKIYVSTRQMLIAGIDRLAALAPVDVVVVVGNHDTQSAFCIGDSLFCWYHNNKRVSVNNGPTKRKYYRYGITLLGFTHGDREKPRDLISLMSHEEPQLWAAAKHREWHLGHKHTIDEIEVVHKAQAQHRTRIRVLPSLSGPDAWHAEEGYLSHQAAESYLWSHDGGYVGHFNHSVHS